MASREGFSLVILFDIGHNLLTLSKYYKLFLFLAIHIWMVLAVLNIFFMIILFVDILGNIADYKIENHNQNNTDTFENDTIEKNDKFKNSDKVMTVVIVYLGAIILLIKSIIVANMARSEILREESRFEPMTRAYGIMAPDLAGVADLIFQMAKIHNPIPSNERIQSV